MTRHSPPGLDVAVVGSGFAGSLLARLLQIQGHRVTLLERSRHPRFALGESSTPLAAICLERLATRYGQEDLRALAARGQWLAELPHLRRGLKRGFTFYLHRPGEPFSNGPGNEHRLLVAASPDDAVADAHWLREDVDAYLAERATAAGVEFLDEVDLTDLEPHGDGFRLTGRRRERAVSLRADVVIDASGAGTFLARQLHLPCRPQRSARVATDRRLATGLLYGHFEGVRSFVEPATESGAAFPPGPYPDECAAVHHLLEEGWMYVLPFDHRVVSAGFVLCHEEGHLPTPCGEGSPEAAWAHLLGRYPSLAAQFADARPVRPIARVPHLQRRLLEAAGPNWALLPHSYTFLSPLFSTGIAWSLLAVERLALVMEPLAGGPGAGRRRLTDGVFTRYANLLATEADHVERLISPAYRLRRDFDLFAEHSFLYFAAVSFAETAQRLKPFGPDGGEWAWDGFLGATDPVLREAVERAERLVASLEEEPSASARRHFIDSIRESIAPRNIAGLGDPARNRLYPVDFDVLLDRAELLGLTADEVRDNLDRLRGAAGDGVSKRQDPNPEI